MTFRLDSARATFLVLLLFVSAVSVLPLARLALEGLAPGGRWDPAAALNALDSRAAWRATIGSLETSIGGTAIALLLGGAMALLVAMTDIRGKAALVFCFVLPMMVPPQVTALAWLKAFGPASPVLGALGLAPPLGTPNPLYGREGIILLLGVQHAPLAFLALRAGLRLLSPVQIEAAQVAGAGPFAVLWRVVLPLLAPAVAAAAALTFVSALGNFGIPALLGIPAKYATLPTLIYQRLAGFGPRVLPDMAALSLVVGGLAMVGIAVQGWALKQRGARLIATARRIEPFQLGRWRPVAEIAGWSVIAAILVLPLAALIGQALVRADGVPLTADSATLANFRAVLLDVASATRAFRNSFLLAGGAALILMAVAVPLAYFLAWRPSRTMRAVAALTDIPYALPGVVLAIACILVYLKPLPVVAISLYGTPWIILLAYLGRFLALATRPVVAAFEQTDRVVEEAASVCGAGFLTTLRLVLLPMAIPAAAAGALLVFLTAFAELTVSALLWSSGVETLGVMVFNFELAGDSSLAAALAVLQVAAIVALMLLAQAFARRLPKGALPWSA